MGKLIKGLFLDAFILNKIPSADPDSIPTAYLAQSDLLEHGDLAAAVPELDLFKAGPQGTMYRRTIWIGPRQSFTPFHRDPYIGLYTQGEHHFAITEASAGNEDLSRPTARCCSISRPIDRSAIRKHLDSSLARLCSLRRGTQRGRCTPKTHREVRVES